MSNAILYSFRGSRFRYELFQLISRIRTRSARRSSNILTIFKSSKNHRECLSERSTSTWVQACSRHLFPNSYWNFADKFKTTFAKFCFNTLVTQRPSMTLHDKIKPVWLKALRSRTRTKQQTRTGTRFGTRLSVELWSEDEAIDRNLGYF